MIDHKEIVAGLQTEMQCFELLEMIGRTNFSYRHNVMDGRLQPDEENDQAAAGLYDIQTRIVEKLEKEFGIVFVPYGSKVAVFVPAGKQLYWSWYEKMKKASKELELQKTICGACPFCEKGRRRYADDVPCTIFRGYATGLFRPWECLMLRESFQLAEREEFLKKMEEASGADAVNVFRQKELRLKLIWSKERIVSYKKAFEKYGAMETGPLLRFAIFLVENRFLSEAAGFMDHLTEKYPDYFLAYPRMEELKTIRKNIPG